MGGPPGSQVAPLPRNLPFRLVSKTIGCGAYASIRKATPLHQTNPVIAVKFINKDHAFRAGRLRPKQLSLELNLHHLVSPHENIIRFLNHGEDAAWVWICMELAEGGDLFDKIEADEGVDEDIAHLYFVQLCSAIAWCHGKGVAHRDIKPENMLLSRDGDLKLADFGLATNFRDTRTGKRKVCQMVCGSPPYIAPEILAVGVTNQKVRSKEEKVGYDPETADVWSCAIVLFVLFAGNTPWDSPVMAESYEFHEYVTTGGRVQDELWEKIPGAALSLVRGMLKVEVGERFSMLDVRKHPWVTRRNPRLNDKGNAANPLTLATTMLESLHIDFGAGVPSSPEPSNSDAMDIDSQSSRPHQDPSWSRFASTQPETPVSETLFDWEAPPRLGGVNVSASQPSAMGVDSHITMSSCNPSDLVPSSASFLHDLSQDPSMSQFTDAPTVPLTLTQQARQFKDILPSHSLARFLSTLPLPQLLPLLLAALHRLNVPVAQPMPSALEGNDTLVRLRITTVDARKQPLHGHVVVERWNGLDAAEGVQVHEVRFLKAKGDPLGWRRLFKHVVVLCKDAIVKPP